MSQKLVNRGGRRSGEMGKACAVCESLDRTALEEGLERGEPYQVLTKQFSVSIGSMKRYRKGHVSGEQAKNGKANSGDETSTRCFLRFGHLPEPDGLSY